MISQEACISGLKLLSLETRGITLPEIKHPVTAPANQKPKSLDPDLNRNTSTLEESLESCCISGCFIGSGYAANVY